MNLLESLLLILVLALDLFTKLVLLVEGGVFVLNNMHLKDSTSGVFLGADDFNLTSMILDLGDDVN